MDPAWISVISAFVGVAAGFAGGIIKDSISYRRDKENQVQEEKQKWLESRKIAYYKFIEVFSTPAVTANILDYFRASLEAAEYGDVILSVPLKTRPYSIAFEIKSLDSLLAALTFMRSTRNITDAGPALDEFMSDFENLRKEALTPFVNEFMNKLRRNESCPSSNAKKRWWRFWK
jgi:hypothetical protein